MPCKARTSVEAASCTSIREIIAAHEARREAAQPATVKSWLLSPVLARAAMSLSSVPVLASSLRLRRFDRTLGPSNV